MYFTHGLFLTCTQKSRLYLVTYILIFTQCTIFYYNALALLKNPCFTSLDGQLSTRGDEFPSTLVPYLVTTAPPLGFYPFLTPEFTVHNC